MLLKFLIFSRRILCDAIMVGEVFHMAVHSSLHLLYVVNTSTILGIEISVVIIRVQSKMLFSPSSVVDQFL